jgi:hypothetical protein
MPPYQQQPQFIAPAQPMSTDQPDGMKKEGQMDNVATGIPYQQ